jgi:hypothetical protein
MCEFLAALRPLLIERFSDAIPRDILESYGETRAGRNLGRTLLPLPNSYLDSLTDEPASSLLMRMLLGERGLLMRRDAPPVDMSLMFDL